MYQRLLPHQHDIPDLITKDDNDVSIPRLSETFPGQIWIIH